MNLHKFNKWMLSSLYVAVLSTAPLADAQDQNRGKQKMSDPRADSQAQEAERLEGVIADREREAAQGQESSARALQNRKEKLQGIKDKYAARDAVGEAKADLNYASGSFHKKADRVMRDGANPGFCQALASAKDSFVEATSSVSQTTKNYYDLGGMPQSAFKRGERMLADRIEETNERTKPAMVKCGFE